MTNLSDICTLVWPVVREADGKLPPNSDNGAWILGWNPVGLSVVVTTLLSNTTFDEARQKLAEVKETLKGCVTPPGVPSYNVLQLLGYVRGSSINTSSSPPAADTMPYGSPTGAPMVNDSKTGNSVREMRKSDIWLELQEGPVLGEVWCCGYRVQPCQLHVIRCDPLKQYSVKPSVFSAVSLYGPGGVAQLKAGKVPIAVPGAESNLEGVLLPAVMLKESGPRVAQTAVARRGKTAAVRTAADGHPPPYNSSPGNSNSTNPEKGFVGFAPVNSEALPSSLLADRRSRRASRHHGGGGVGSGGAEGTSNADDDSIGDFVCGSESESDTNTPSFLYVAGTQSFAEAANAHSESMSQHFRHEDEAAGLISPTATPRPGVPPRLDFPTSTDRAEMGTLLRMCAVGYNVQCALQGEGPPHPAAREAVSGHRHNVLSASRGSSEGTSTFASGRAPAERLPSTTSFGHLLLSGLIELNLALLRVAAPLRRVSWLMEIVEHRLRELVNLLSLLDNRTHSCGLHPALPHRTRQSQEGRLMCYINYLARVFTDVGCGSLIMLLLRTQGPRMYTMAMHMSRFFIYELHMSYMDWFDGWPAGLKVNEDLNQALCFFAKVVLRLWDLCMRSLFFVDHHINASARTILNKDSGLASSAQFNEDHDVFGSTEYFWIVPSYDVLVPLSFLGASCSFALVADITGIVTFHLRFLYHFMSLPYRFTRAVMSSLSNQFRGKKHNPLRNRTDVYEFTVDQMLMATFIFTIVVFLFPTMAVYYFYFALIRTSVWCVQESLVALAYAMLYLPVWSFVAFSALRDRLTEHFGGGVELSEPMVTMQRTNPSANSGTVGPLPAHHTRPSTTVEVTVLGKPFSPSCVFSDFVYVIMALAKPFVPNKVISLIFSGRSSQPTSPREDLIPHLVANCVDPPCTLCVPPDTPPSLLSSATTAAAISISSPSPPH